MRNRIITNIFNEIYSVLEIGQTQEEIEDYLGVGRTTKITQQYKICRYLELISDKIDYQTYNIGAATGRIKCFIEIKFEKGIAIEIIKKGIDGIYNKTLETKPLYKKDEHINQKLITWETKLHLASQKENEIINLNSDFLYPLMLFCYNGNEVSYAQILINFPMLSIYEDKLLCFLSFLKKENFLLIKEKEIFSPVKKCIKWNANQKLPMMKQETLFNEKDEKFIEVRRFVIEKQEASIGMIQRRFAMGFNRAAQIIDQLEREGVIAPQEGKESRKVLLSIEEFNEKFTKQ